MDHYSDSMARELPSPMGGNRLEEIEAMRQHVAVSLSAPRYRDALLRSLRHFSSDDISRMVMLVEHFREIPSRRNEMSSRGKKYDQQTLRGLIAGQETNLIRIAASHLSDMELHGVTFGELIELLKALRAINLLSHGSEKHSAVAAHLQIMEVLPDGNNAYMRDRKLMVLVQRHYNRVDELTRLVNERGFDFDTLSQYLNHDVRVMAGGAL